MPITFHCQCGKTLSAKDADAGLAGVCPGCGRKVVVPASGSVAGESSPVDQLDSSARRLDRWIFAHQRLIWLSTAVLGLAVITLLVGNHYWRKEKLARAAAERARHYVPTPEHGDRINSADPSLWESNFYSFAAAVKAAVKGGENLENKFTGHEVRWTVTFHDFLEQRALYFEEAEPLRKDNRAILVWATLLPSEADKADRLKRGARLTLHGKIGPVTSARSAANPYEEIRLGPIDCLIESP